jgi:hypothetical protein
VGWEGAVRKKKRRGVDMRAMRRQAGFAGESGRGLQKRKKGGTTKG